eukprot:TRINITY_DN3564_c0_g3_i1.p1 TRINITY_DN3564_c0_g3~~TRINITY_DN3564_c0_g3_i1.p1  ORF type:complete len:397 (+),score=66.06 TRINITY_DN3564_c0_g3_i1:240-1430(+)
MGLANSGLKRLYGSGTGVPASKMLEPAAKGMILDKYVHDVPQWRSPPLSPSSAPIDALGRGAFVWLSVVGEGTYGKVTKVSSKCTGAVLACKEQRRDGPASDPQNEADILSKLSHPFVVGLHGSFESNGSLCMLLDFLPGGDLMQHVLEGGCCSEDRARVYLAEAALALAYLREHNVVHRDVKLENLVLNSSGHAVLIDFGFARVLSEGETTTDVRGTLPYMAPEALTRGSSFEADWWSLGVCLFVMLSGCYPFWVARSDGKLAERATSHLIRRRSITPEQFPVPANTTVSLAARQLCAALLRRSPSDRPSSVTALQRFDWYKDFDWTECARGRLAAPHSRIRPATGSPIASGCTPGPTDSAPRTSTPESSGVTWLTQLTPGEVFIGEDGGTYVDT